MHTLNPHHSNPGAAGKSKSIMAINALNFRDEATKKILKMGSDSGPKSSPQGQGQGNGSNITPRAPNMTDKKLSHKALSKMFGVDPTKTIGSTVVPFSGRRGMDLSSSQRSIVNNMRSVMNNNIK